MVVLALAIGSATARAEWVTRNVGVGGLPRAIGVNPVTNRVYLAQEDSASIFVLRPADGSIKRIAVGSAPSAIAVNPATNRIYCANQSSASVSVVDGATDAVIATVSVGSGPYTAVVNPFTNKIFVTSIDTNTLSVIDGETNTLERSIATGTNPRALCVNPLTNIVYVANRGSASVTKVDANTWTTTTISVGSSPNAIAVNPTTNKIYVANQGSSNVTVIDGATDGKATVGAGSNPYVLGVDPVNNQIYCGNVAAATVTVINGATNGTTTVTVGTNPVSIAVNPVTQRAYVCNLGSSYLSVIDGATKGVQSVTIGSSGLCSVVSPWTGKAYVGRNISSGTGLVEVDATTNVPSSVTVGTGPVAVAANGRTHRGYVANGTAGTVTEVDLSTRAVAATVVVGTAPQAVATDPVRNRIYVANSGSGTVSIIDGGTRGVSSVTVGAGPRALALDLRLNRLFVANHTDNTVSVVSLGDNAVSTVDVGVGPVGLVFDPVSDACWAVNRGDNTLSKITSALEVESIEVGVSPAFVALDPVTHRIFTANSGDNTVSVVDGVTGDVAPVTVGTTPVAIAVDAVNGQAFVADSAASVVTAIRESDLSTESITVGSRPVSLAINPHSGRLYVGTLGSVNTWIVDLRSHLSTTASLAASPRALAVDEVLGVMLAVPASGTTAPVVLEAGRLAQPLNATITALSCDQALGAGQSLSGTATSTRTPSSAGILKVYVALDDPALGWTEVPITSGAGTPTVAWAIEDLLPGAAGPHVLYAAALDATSATLDNSSQHAGSVFTGLPADYTFVTVPEAVPPTHVAGTVRATVIARPYETTPVLRALTNARVSVVHPDESTSSTLSAYPSGAFSFNTELQCGDQLMTALENDRLKVIDVSGSTCSTQEFPEMTSPLSAGSAVNFVWPVTGGGISGDAANAFYLAEKYAREYWQGRVHHTPGPLWIVRVNATTGGGNGAGETGAVGSGFACSSFMPGATSHADAIYHEFGHRMVIGQLENLLGYGAVKDGKDVYPQAAGMDEGFADYFTASFTNDSRITNELDHVLRNLSQTIPLQYDLCLGTYDSNRYYGALVFGGALWDLRGALTGLGVADSTFDRWVFNFIATYSTPAYADPASRTFLSFRNLMRARPLSSSHDDAIVAAFARHNIQDDPVAHCTGRPEIQAVERVIDEVQGQLLTVIWKKAPEAIFHRVYARIWPWSGTGIETGILVADSLTDSTFTYVVADTTARVSFVVVGLNAEGNEGPEGSESPGILDVPASHAPTVQTGLALALAPNPARGPIQARITSPERQHIRVRVYDVSGRLARTLWEGEIQPGVPLTPVWDLCGGDGRRVSPGIYMVRVEGHKQSTGARTVVLW